MKNPRPAVTMRNALTDKRLLGNVIFEDSWRAWRLLLIAAMGERLTPEEREIFQRFTGRGREPGRRVEEFVVVKGRRAGGSRAAAVLATYIAGLGKHPALVPGERGVLLIVAADQRQADVILDYCEAIFRSSPVLHQLIANRTQRELRLTTNVDIEVRACDFRRLRGLTFVAVIADELAFWMTNEGASNPDDEILAAVRPGLATTGGPMFIISSPYAKRGELWRIFQKYFRPDGDPLVLVARGSSRDFNSTLPQSVVDRAMARDPASASAEYLAQFRNDLEAFISREVIDGCIQPGRYELPPVAGISYYGFVDPSGGSADSMTIGIAHRATDRGVLDCVRERKPPFSPDDVVQEFATLLKSYRLNRVVGDRYAGEWPAERFRAHNIKYEASERTKSEIYGEVLPLLNSGRIELLDSQRLISQLLSLERRVRAGGRDAIDHGPGQHDDVCNAAAGALVLASGQPSKAESWAAWAKADLSGFGVLDASRSAILYSQRRFGGF